MPVPNLGLQRTRNRVANLPAGTPAPPVDSIGVGSNSAAESASDVKLGAGAGALANSYWKSGGSMTVTSGGDATADPWWQFEALWSTDEANDTLFELGTSAGTLTGTSPAGNDGTALYTRKRIGGAGGIGKTADIQLAGRVKVTY